MERNIPNIPAGIWLGFELKSSGRRCLQPIVRGLSSEETPELLPTKSAREFSTGQSTGSRHGSSQPSSREEERDAAELGSGRARGALQRGSLKNKNPGRASNVIKPLNLPPPSPCPPAHPHPQGAGAGIAGGPGPGEEAPTRPCGCTGSSAGDWRGKAQKSALLFLLGFGW